MALLQVVTCGGLVDTVIVKVKLLPTEKRKKKIKKEKPKKN